MLFVILACRPPIFSTNLSTIQDDAEPLAIRTMSLRRDPQLFQKDSNASTNSDCGVSIHGISSMKMTLRLSSGRLSIYSSRASKASSQEESLGWSLRPAAFFSALANPRNCFALVSLNPPTKEKSYFFSKNVSTRNVLPTRLRPYTITSSERSLS